MNWPFNDNFKILIENKTENAVAFGSWVISPGETAGIPFNVCLQRKRLYKALQDKEGFFFRGFVLGDKEFLRSESDEFNVPASERPKPVVKNKAKRSEDIEPPSVEEPDPFMFTQKQRRDGVTLEDVLPSAKDSSLASRFIVKDEEYQDNGELDPLTLEPLVKSAEDQEVPRGNGKVDPATLEPVIDIYTMTKKELVAHAKDIGVSHYGNKGEILERIELSNNESS